jgi:hypothetical protein
MCLRGAVFYLHATRAHPLGRATISAQIAAGGGAVARTLARATHVVATPAAVVAGGPALDQAAQAGLPVVGREYVAACIAAGARLPEAAYYLSLAGQAPAPATPPEPPASASTALASQNDGPPGNNTSAAAGAVTASLGDGGGAAAAVADDGDGAARTVTVVVKGHGAVDPDSGLAEGYHVMERRGAVYSATLSRTDLSTGRNSYYALQVRVARLCVRLVLASSTKRVVNKRCRVQWAATRFRCASRVWALVRLRKRV